MRDLFIHVHIPKCGGMTFAHILKKNFGSNYRRESCLLLPPRYDASDVKIIVGVHPNLRACSSHKFSLDLPFELSGVRLIPIVFVRNPVDHFLSQYFFHRNHLTVDKEFYENANGSVETPLERRVKTKELSIEQFVQYWDTEYGKWNDQSRFLYGDAYRDAVEQTKHLAENRHLQIFPLERMDEACLVLKNTFPDDFADCTYITKNVTNKRQSVTDELRDQIAGLIDVDFELHQTVDTLLDARLKRVFGSSRAIQAALTEFQEKCERERQRERRREMWRGLKARIARMINY